MNAPGSWIAFLRIVVGTWFLESVWTKLAVSYAWGFFPYLDVAPRFLNFSPTGSLSSRPETLSTGTATFSSRSYYPMRRCLHVCKLMRKRLLA
jgi:hypothetical protein